MFYDIFCELCEKRGLTPSGAAAQIGFNRASVTVWKNTGRAPKQDLLLKIAEYFGVTTDYLLGTEKEKTPPTEDREELLRFALWDGDKGITQAQIDEIKRFAAFIKERDKNDGK